jgi:glycosyltransferase involved in cell wall biosynthesis
MSVRLADAPAAVKTAALLTHSSPEETGQAVRAALAAAARRAVVARWSWATVAARLLDLLDA